MTIRDIEGLRSGVRNSGADVEPLVPPEIASEGLYQVAITQLPQSVAQEASRKSYVEGGTAIEAILRQAEHDARGHNRVRRHYGAENLLMYEDEIRTTRNALQHLMNLENPVNPTGLHDRIQTDLKIYDAFMEKIEQLKTQGQTKQ